MSRDMVLYKAITFRNGSVIKMSTPDSDPGVQDIEGSQSSQASQTPTRTLRALSRTPSLHQRSRTQSPLRQLSHTPPPPAESLSERRALSLTPSGALSRTPSLPHAVSRTPTPEIGIEQRVLSRTPSPPPTVSRALTKRAVSHTPTPENRIEERAISRTPTPENRIEERAISRTPTPENRIEEQSEDRYSPSIVEINPPTTARKPIDVKGKGRAREPSPIPSTSHFSANTSGAKDQSVKYGKKRPLGPDLYKEKLRDRRNFKATMELAQDERASGLKDTKNQSEIYRYVPPPRRGPIAIPQAEFAKLPIRSPRPPRLLRTLTDEMGWQFLVDGDRCARCVALGEKYCTVDRDDFKQLSSWALAVASGETHEPRPPASICQYCRSWKVPDECRFPIMDEYLGPGFTHNLLLDPTTKYPVIRVTPSHRAFQDTSAEVSSHQNNLFLSPHVATSISQHSDSADDERGNELEDACDEVVKILYKLADRFVLLGELMGSGKLNL
ncbi:hypothetical protein BDN70DRAFT_939656 [Pholiota conissans]|uniref:Uncharacterized protein n=1 Tax=Pholiota conissans TaxID=109636 RepID=A0A9P6CRX7_9AGAR|nr:hypothetical protein BDN70DRAFT_939656 [Pholiota conissans]